MNGKAIKTNSWLEIPPDSDFPLQNIPFGIIKLQDGNTTVATRIGNYAVNLSALYELDYLEDLEIPPFIFENQYLNDFIALGKQVTNGVRKSIMELFEQDNPRLRDNAPDKEMILTDVSKVEKLIPVKIGDYTDFYSSKEHATNVGSMFRDPKNALLPNWLHLPVAYHGRTSSIFVSGFNFHRPKGQIVMEGEDKPLLSPSKRLDFELETAFVIGKSTEPGESVPVEKAEEYIFGMVLFNDWSARDIQKWEYVPLGPFLAKNFASTISPWVVTLEALEPFRTKAPEQNPAVLPYLEQPRDKVTFAINLEVWIQPCGKENKTEKLSSSNFNYLYWSMSQQLAHHTINGCNINIGDLMASGTISGMEQSSYGSLLELTWNGTKPLHLLSGETRKFLEDGDRVIIKGFCNNGDIRIGFGEAEATILPAI